MAYCPKTAPAFNTTVKDEHAAEWCRRQYKSGSQQCFQCDLGIKYGVVVEAAPKDEPENQPVQARLF